MNEIPDSMSRATANLLHPQVHGSSADGDTVVACPNGAARDCNTPRRHNVDSVSVGASTWCNDLHILYPHVATVINGHVDRLAVVRC